MASEPVPAVPSAPATPFASLDAVGEGRVRELACPVRAIGYVRTAYAEPGDTPIQTAHNPDARGLLVVFDEYAAGLADLGGFDYALLLAYLDRVPEAGPGDDPPCPVPFLLREHGQRRGVFATRYPVRPNPVTLSLVRIEAVGAAAVVFTGVDLADGTPILDVKPWVAGFDLPPGTELSRRVACGWYDDLTATPAGSAGPSPLTLVASTLAGRDAFVARTGHLDGFGAAETSEVAILDRRGVRAGCVLGGALDAVLLDAVRDASAGATATLLHLDVDNSAAASAGLTCGGRATVALQPLDQVPSRWWRAREQRRAIALVTNISGRHCTGSVAGALVDVAQLGPRDALVVLDHDVRSTGPVLAAALDGEAGYVGALGSRRTQARRADYLRELGLTETQLARLHGPTGLDIGAANRAETALSICAEIISERTGRSARPLRETTGSITR